MPWVFLIALPALLLALILIPRDRTRVAFRWVDAVAVLGLALATAGFFWRVIAGQNWMPADGGDLVSFLYPTYRFAAGSLHAGAWPLWNPYLYTGTPHVADIQAGFLYPPNLLLFLLWPDFPYAALQWLSMAHIWFAGSGMYLLLRRWERVGVAPALAGALAFMFCDALLTHFGNLNLNAVASWLPWVFMAFLPVLHGGAVHRAALAGLLLGIATLAGHVQATLFILLALGVYTLLYLWLGRTTVTRSVALRAIGGLLLVAGVAAGVAAPVLLPALELAGYTARAGWSYAETAGYSLSPAQWIGWLIPGFFGRGPQFHWGAWPRVESGYAGILTLVLAALGLLLRRDRRAWAWLGLAGVAFLLASGIYTIAHGWLTTLPGFGQLRAPGRMVLLVSFPVAALAAFGLERLLQPLDEAARTRLESAWRLLGRAAAVTWAVAVPLAYAVLLLVSDRDAAIVVRVSITLLAVVTFAVLLLVAWLWLTAVRGGWAAPGTLAALAVLLIYLDVASLGAYQDLGTRDPTASFAHPALAGYLGSQPGPYRIDARTGIDSVWQPDTALLYRLEDTYGLANPLLLADVARYWDGLGSRSSRLYDLLNTGWVLGRKDVVLDWEKFEPAFAGDPDLNAYRNRRALPRAFFVRDVQAAADHEAAWAAIREPGFDPSLTAVVEADGSGPAGTGAVTGVEMAPNRTRIQAAVASETPALLVVSQVWYPGWEVWVDGQNRGRPLRVDYLFQGVPVEFGEHIVELRFAPPLWRAGWVVAGLTAISLLAVARRGRRRTE